MTHLLVTRVIQYDCLANKIVATTAHVIPAYMRTCLIDQVFTPQTVARH